MAFLWKLCFWGYCHKLYTGSSFIKHWCVYNGSWWLRSRSSTQAFFHVSRVVSQPWKNAPFTDAGQLSQLWCSARKESNTYHRSPIFTRIVALKINDISDQVFEFSRQNDFFFMQGWFLDKWQVFRCHVQKLNFLSFQSWVCIIHSPLPLGVVVTQTIFHVICIERTVLIKSPWGCKDVVEWWYGNNQNGCSSQGENKELRTQEKQKKKASSSQDCVCFTLQTLQLPSFDTKCP